MNFTQVIATVAKRQPQAPALRSGAKGMMTYAELDASIAQLAGILAQEGVAAGDTIGISMATSPLHLLTILALARLGSVSLSLPIGHTPSAGRELARRYRMKLIVDHRAARIAPGLPRVLIRPGWQRAAVRTIATPAKVATDAPWRIALSSGTTGTLKAVLYRHGDPIDYARRSVSVTPGGAGAGTRLLCFMGLGAGFTLRPCLRHLLCGGAVAFAGSTGPRAMIDAFRASQVTHAVTSPTLLRAVCDLLDDGGPHFPDLIHLAVGGAVMPPALVARAQARITPHVYSHYGASEAGLVALAGPAMLRDRPECAGKLMTWVEAQAVDNAGRVLGPGEPGELRFRGPGIAQAYFCDPDASARSFRGGWFHPGDYGRIERNGLLFVEGRVDDRINLGGRKFDPGVIERVLEKHPQVIEAGVFAVQTAPDTHQLCAAVVLRGSLRVRVLLEHCRDALGPRLVPARFLTLRTLPRNSDGKLLRRELQHLMKTRERATRRSDAAR